MTEQRNREIQGMSEGDHPFAGQVRQTWLDVCGDWGPRPRPSVPFRCTRPPEHPGAHAAVTPDGDQLDSWGGGEV